MAAVKKQLFIIFSFLWGIGTALLILLEAGLHLLLAVWRRRGGGSGPRWSRQIAA
jgi:hypothetical protein